MQRQGECDLCGQCCGAEGSPYQRNPWPKGWPDTIRNWLFETFVQVWPHAQLVGLEAGPNGTVIKTGEYGNHNIRGHQIHWRWVPGHALCKNLEPYGDPSTYSLECPWLLPDPGDGTRPCALVGTRYEPYWAQACEVEPPMEKDADQAEQWAIRHPLCSYEWV